MDEQTLKPTVTDGLNGSKAHQFKSRKLILTVTSVTILLIIYVIFHAIGSPIQASELFYFGILYQSYTGIEGLNDAISIIKKPFLQ